MSAAGARQAGPVERLAATAGFKVAVGLSVLVAVLILLSGLMLALGMSLMEGASAAPAAAGLLVWVLAGVVGLIGLGYGGSWVHAQRLTHARMDAAIICLIVGILAASGVLAVLAVLALLSVTLGTGAMRYDVPVFTAALVAAAHLVMIVAAFGRAARLTRLYEARTGRPFDVVPAALLFVALANAVVAVSVTILIGS